MKTEFRILLCFAASAGVGYLLLFYYVPFMYELLSRLGNGDYSYLWNGFSIASRAWAPRMVLLVILVGVVTVCIRIFRLWFHIRKNDVCFMSLVSIIQREFITFSLILALSGIVFAVSKASYLNLKREYFETTVSRLPGYESLSVNDRLKARQQYDSLNPSAQINGVLQTYGLEARLAYYSQAASFWIIIFGYPAVLFFRLLFWSGRLLKSV